MSTASLTPMSSMSPPFDAALPSSPPSPSLTPRAFPAHILSPGRPLNPRRVTVGPPVQLSYMVTSGVEGDTVSSAPAMGASRSAGASPTAATFRRAEGEDALSFAQEWKQAFGGPLELSKEIEEESAGSPSPPTRIVDLPAPASSPPPSHLSLPSLDPNTDDNNNSSSPTPRSPLRLSLSPHRLSLRRGSGPITPPAPLVLTDQADLSTPFDFGPFVAQLDSLALERNAQENVVQETDAPLIPDFADFVRDSFQLRDEATEAALRRPVQDGVNTLPFPSSASTVSLLGTYPDPLSPIRERDAISVQSFDLIDFSPKRKSLRIEVPRASSGLSSADGMRTPTTFGDATDVMATPTPLSSSRRNESVTGTPTRAVEEEQDPTPIEGEQQVDTSLDDSFEQSSGGEEEEEEEDPDTHPLYILLSTSPLPALRRTWEASTLVLVPPRRTLPSLLPLAPRPSSTSSSSGSPAKGFEFVRGGKGFAGELAGRDEEKKEREEREEREGLETFVALHAFRPEGEGWRSVGGGSRGFLRARLEPSARLVHLEWVSLDPTSAPPFPSTTTTSQPTKLASPSTLSLTSSSSSLPSLSSSTVDPISIAPSQRDSTDSESSAVLPLTPPAPLDASLLPPAPLNDECKTPTIAASSSSPPISPPPSTSRTIQVTSETTIYRRSAPSSTPAPPTRPPPPAKSSRSAFRPSKWFRRGGSSAPSLRTLEESAGASAQTSKSSKPMLERVRVMAVDNQVIFDWSVAVGRAIGEEGLGIAGEEKAASATSLLPSKRDGSSLELTKSFGTVGGSGRRARAGSVSSARSVRSHQSHRSGRGGVSGAVPHARDFVADLAFLAMPPAHLASIAPALTSALATLRTLASDFEGNFVYVKGFDSYTVKRIRQGIADPIWALLASDLAASGDVGTRIAYGSEEQLNLHLLLETVLMGLLYSKLYISSIVPLYRRENAESNRLIALYRLRQLSPADLGVEVCDLGRGQGLYSAVNALRAIGHLLATSNRSIVSPELVSAICVDGADAQESTRKTIIEARTPLGCISAMRTAIDNIMLAVEEADPGVRIAPDDLIPLFAWVIVECAVEDLQSLLYYVKTFRLSDELAPELEWSLVTFQTALAFLMSDPLDVLATSPPPMTSTVPFPSTSPSQRRTTIASPSSLSGTSSTSELHIQPRIVLPPRSTTLSSHSRRHSSSLHAPSTPPLSRSQSNLSSRQIGPAISADMRRSESEGSPSTRVAFQRFNSDGWSLWSGGGGRNESPASSERAASPAFSDRTSASAGGNLARHHVSAFDDHQSWLAWGRERLGSMGPASEGASMAAARLEQGIEDRRARRHSASAAELLGIGPRTLSLPLEPTSASTQRLNAILAARNGGTTRPRPRSIVSTSSFSSIDSYTTAEDGTFLPSPSLSRSATNLSLPTPRPPPPRRRTTRSTHQHPWRELPSSNLVSKPLAPQLDSSSVLSLPTALPTAAGPGEDRCITPPPTSSHPTTPRSVVIPSRVGSLPSSPR